MGTKKKRDGYELPLLLNTKPFRDAWELWLEHRKQKRATLTSLAARMQLDDLELMGEQRAIAAIRHSIKQGYTGLFEPSQMYPARVDRYSGQPKNGF